MHIGRMGHRVTIQKDTKNRDTHGGPVHVWSDVATVWASVEPLTGKEILDADQVKANVTHRVRIRSYDGLTPKHRFLFGTRVLNIEVVRDIRERNVEMECLCKEAL